jgi:hypothetical protein
MRKLGGLHLGQEFEISKNAGRRRNKRFSDMRPWKKLALEHHAIHTGLGQITSHGRSRRPTTYDCDVKIWFRNNQRFLLKTL